MPHASLLPLGTERPLDFPVTVSAVSIQKKGAVYVLREDRLDGGTKSRALRPFLTDLWAKGYREFAYASPFAGFAQLALAYACRDLDLPCRLFAQADPHLSGDRLVPHAITLEAERAGARVTLEPSLEAAEESCSMWQPLAGGRIKVPLGLDCHEYRQHLKTAIGDVWDQVCRGLGTVPARVWVSLGSGTLSSEMRTVLPLSVELCCINVHVLDEQDPRIVRVRSLPNSRYFAAPDRFATRCENLPPIPSNLHYDAKVWSFLLQHAEPGDLWWNVAR